MGVMVATDDEVERRAVEILRERERWDKHGLRLVKEGHECALPDPDNPDRPPAGTVVQCECGKAYQMIKVTKLGHPYPYPQWIPTLVARPGPPPSVWARAVATLVSLVTIVSVYLSLTTLLEWTTKWILLLP